MVSTLVFVCPEICVSARRVPKPLCSNSSSPSVTYQLHHAGFPLPFLPLGFWGTLLPRRVPSRFVVGPPVRPLDPVPHGTIATAADVDELHARFYDAVGRLWARHRGEHPAYRGMRLELVGE